MPQHRRDTAVGVHPPPPPKPKTNLLSFLLKTVIMMSITSLFFLLLGLASLVLIPLFLSSLHRRHHRLGHNCSESSKGLSPKRIKKMSQFKFLSKNTTTTADQNDCVVCLEGFTQGQWCRRLIGCGHVFHRKCVDTWLAKVAACPICRARVCVAEEEGGNEKVEFWGSFGGRRRSRDLLDL